MTLYIGTVVDERWKVQGPLGHGSFGTAYRVVDTHHPTHSYALKIEKDFLVEFDDRLKPFNSELYVMKHLNRANAQYAPRLKAHGSHQGRNYVVMDLLGANLTAIKRKLPDNRFTLADVLRIGRDSLRAVEELHRNGFLHRDIKPSNFAVGKTDPKELYIFDFGCCREYQTPSGRLKPSRGHVMYRGTPRYASIDVLNGRDWSRADDLWSWFFCLIELTTGRLPWDVNPELIPTDDNEYITWLAGKKRRLLYDPDWLLYACPDEYNRIYGHLMELTFDDKPKYALLFTVLNGIADKCRLFESDLQIEP